MNTIAKNTTILIVDDEEALRDAIAFDFRRAKFNVITAASGHEAMKLVEKERIDVVLSDVRMPDGDGVELLDFIRSKNPVVPVIMFITGFADIALEDAYDRGVDAVFAKPFDRKALMSAVLNAIQPMEQRYQRKSSRAQGGFSVGLRFMKTGQSVQAKSVNIGRGGMCMMLDAALPEVDELVEFRLTSSQGLNVMLEGEGIVRWVRNGSQEGKPSACGIEFVGLGKDCVAQLVALVNTLKTKSYIPKI